MAPNRFDAHETGAPDPLAAGTEFWRRAGNLAELWWSRQAVFPRRDIAGQRLRRLVDHAREHSAFYRAWYAKVPPAQSLGPDEGAQLLAQLPPVKKAQLMDHFDGWSTDPRVRREELEHFLADRGRIGEKFMGRYYAFKSSGTSGRPGIFLQDSAAMAVYDALVAAHVDAGAIGAAGIGRILAAGGRAALVVATGDHFAGITAWERLRHVLPGARRSFSVLEPLATLVRELNAFAPAFLAAYPSVLWLLAAEREAGRLRIAPALLWSGGEMLAEAARQTIERAFQCRVMNEYGASECLSMAHECAAGCMHVNSEWVILEGVEADGTPTPRGVLSHTVLLTNLANRIQPVIRYDLGDRMVTLAQACGCGDPRPAIRIEGRSDKVLELKTRSRRTVCLAPLAISTVVEEAAGAHRFQVAQVAPDRLVVRFDAQAGAHEALWKSIHGALCTYLAAQSLGNVRVELDAAPPRLDPRSGKLHAVVVERPAH
jgi:putative adenylate-forming enzyme